MKTNLDYDRFSSNNRITTVSGTSFTEKKLKAGTYHKFLIVAVGSDKALATSKTIHAAASGGKIDNAKNRQSQQTKGHTENMKGFEDQGH